MTRQKIKTAFIKEMKALGYDYDYVLQFKGLTDESVERLSVNMMDGSEQEFSAIRECIQEMEIKYNINIENLRLEI